MGSRIARRISMALPRSCLENLRLRTLLHGLTLSSRSEVSARLHIDPRMTVYLTRTHLGGCGPSARPR